MSNSKKGFLQIAFLSILAYPLSFINQMILSYYFGTSSDVDSYYLSLTIVNFFIFFIFPAQEVLIPKFFNIFSKDNNKGKLYLSRQLVFLAIPLIMSFFIVIFFPKEIYRIFAEGSISDRTDYAKYVIYLSPLIFLLSITTIFNYVLLSFNKFIFQNIGRIFGTIFSLIFVLVFARFIGIYALILGTVFSTLFLLTIQLIELKKMRFRLNLIVKPLFERDFINKTSILLVGYGASQVAVLAERYILINFEKGALSGYQYAFNLSQIPQNIVIVAVLGVIWPRMLNETYISKVSNIFDITINSIKKVIIFFSFLSLFCFLNSKEIIFLVYLRGAFSWHSLEITNICFKSLSLLFVPFGISAILMKNLTALQSSLMMTKSTILSSFAALLCLIIGYHFNSLQIISLHPVVSTSSMTLLLIYQVIDANNFILNRRIILNTISWFLKLFIIIGLVYVLSITFNDVKLEKIEVTLFLAWKFILLTTIYIFLLLAFKLIYIKDFTSWRYLFKKKEKIKQ